MLGRACLEVFPNREWRATFTPERGPSHRKTLESHHETDDNSSPAKAVTCHSFKIQNQALSADSGDRPEQKIKAGYGRVGRQSKFSGRAKNTILRSGGALEHLYQPSECLFLTLTLPGSTDESMRAIAQWSGYLVNCFKAWLSKRLPHRYEMYVWEWQRRGALHLHYVVGCPDRALGEEIRQSLQAQWIRLLDAVCNKSGVDVYKKNSGFSHSSDKTVVKVDAQWCEKSVAAYLSKYVSKESSKNRNRVNKRYYPSQWYGVSRPLLAKLRELTVRIQIDNMTRRSWDGCYEDTLSVLQSLAIRCYSYRHQVGAGRTIVAYCHDSEKEGIWMEMKSQTQFVPKSSQSTRDRQTFLINRGLYLLRNNWRWRKTFSALSSGYVTSLVSCWRNSKPMTPADTTYLLDTLTYTLSYHRSITSSITGAESAWLLQAKAANEDALRSGLTLALEWPDEEVSQATLDSGT